MKKMKFYLVGFILLFITISLAQAVAGNAFATRGIELDTIEQELQYYKKQNALLREKLLTEASLSKIASEASHMGFVESKSPVVITAPLPIALKQ